MNHGLPFHNQGKFPTFLLVKGKVVVEMHMSNSNMLK
jgi:hypothetical protein